MPHSAKIAERFEQALLAIDRVNARQILQEAFQDSGPLAALDRILTPALEHIGAQWEAGQAALSQVYMSGVICEDLLAEFSPRPPDESTEGPPIAIVTFEDYHALGKRLVSSILHAQGLPVRDFGVGVQADELARLVQAQGIELLLISTLMFPSALHIARVRELLEQAGQAVTIVVGGAPFRFDEHLWQRVGADAMGRTAADAVKLTKHFRSM